MKLINSVRRASRRATRTLKRSAKKASNTVRRSVKYLSKSMKRSGKKASNTVRRSVRKTKRATRKTVRGLAKSVGSLGKRNYSKKSKRSCKKSKRSVKHGGAIRLPGEYFGNDSGRYGSSAAGTSTSGCATHNDLKISNPGTVMNGGGRGCSSCKF